MKINYLNNKDILKEIHKSKLSFCSFPNPEDGNYDVIIKDIAVLVDPDFVETARQLRADRLSKEAHDAAKSAGESGKADQYAVPLESVAATDVVFRLMTWAHIPEAELKEQPEAEPDEELVVSEYEEPLPIKYVKVNFPPFQHYKISGTGEPVCVGKSHWRGDLETGFYSRDHGQMTNKLATMFIKLCERYATRSNWRGYCVDEATEALTQRGWVDHAQITENDTILSFDGKNLKWSNIKSIFRDHNFDGKMHYLTSRGLDSLITPNHKIVTKRGLVPVELLKESDRIILMGDEEAGAHGPIHSDAMVELAGWILTEGNYDVDDTGEIRSIRIYQNEGEKADRIRHCLNTLDFKFSESKTKNISFSVSRHDSKVLARLLPKKELKMDFILSLTAAQRKLLVDTMVDGDGWHRGCNYSYVQKSKEHIDAFQALVTLTGRKSNIKLVEDHISFGKKTSYYTMNIFSARGNATRGECIDMHGGKNNGKESGMIGKGKINHQNTPTVQYTGTVWCPETEYGCFVARRNGKVYLTGNTYNDEMRSQALLQLSQIGLQFDESKSQNPFAYYTATITNSFTRVLNIEKRNQNIRDDIMEMNGLNPSYTRQGMGFSSGPTSYEE